MLYGAPGYITSTATSVRPYNMGVDPYMDSNGDVAREIKRQEVKRSNKLKLLLI